MWMGGGLMDGGDDGWGRGGNFSNMMYSTCRSFHLIFTYHQHLSHFAKQLLLSFLDRYYYIACVVNYPLSVVTCIGCDS